MKKNFKNTNAAAAFITAAKQPETKPAAKKPQPQKEEADMIYMRQAPKAEDGERRTERMSFIFRPSIARKLREIAYKRGISSTYLLENLIEDAK